MAEEPQSSFSGPGTVPPVPRIWSTHATVLGTDKEVVVLCGAGATRVDSKGEAQYVSVPSVQLSMPPAAAKELIHLLTEAVGAIEKEIGEVSSAFLRDRVEK